MMLEQTRAVAAEEVSPEIVTMNSTVRLVDEQSGTTTVRTLVYPIDSFRGRCISVLDPLGMALFGARVGEIVRPRTGRSEGSVRVEEILYQPEASGNFHR
jgi:regulator of nucleoside diphosphate kinase